MEGPSEPELDFLGLALANQTSAGTAEHTENEIAEDEDKDGDGEEEEEEEDDDALGRELADFLSQTTSSGPSIATQSMPSENSSDTRVSSLPANGDVSMPQEHGDTQSHDQYLIDLAAVLQAAQAIQAHGPNANIPAFHPLNASSQPNSENIGQQSPDGALGNDLTELLAHLTAQLEQAGEHNTNAPATNHSVPTILNGGGSAAPDKLMLFPPPSWADTSSHHILTSGTASASAPPPSSAPNHNNVSPSYSTTPQAEAGPSTQKADTSKRKGKGKGKGKDEGSGPKLFACEFCEKTFGRGSDAKRHAKIHTNDRPFVCAHAGCGKSFIQRSALHVHLRVHSGEKPHACEYPGCGRTFSDSSSLARHRRTHTGRRPYACEHADCAKTFTRRTTLTAHMRTHDPTWEPDPNVRYDFKSKRRKTEGGDEGGEQDGEASLEDSVRTLSSLLNAGPDGAMRPHLGADGIVQDNPGAPLEARVAAISAEIAAAIAQAQIQAQMNEEDDDDDDDEESSEDEGSSSINARGMNVSGIRTEQPPQTSTHPSFPASVSVPAPDSILGFPLDPALAHAQNHGPVTNGDEEDEMEDFPVPLRERKSRINSTIVGSKRKR